MQEVDELRAEAEARGVKVDGRWGVDRLRAEIEAAQPVDKPDEGEGQVDEPDEDESAEDGSDEDGSTEDEPNVRRAGGHVDRGDGRGWVLEE